MVSEDYSSDHVPIASTPRCVTEKGFIHWCFLLRSSATNGQKVQNWRKLLQRPRKTRVKIFIANHKPKTGLRRVQTESVSQQYHRLGGAYRVRFILPSIFVSLCGQNRTRIWIERRTPTMVIWADLCSKLRGIHPLTQLVVPLFTPSQRHNREFIQDRGFV